MPPDEYSEPITITPMTPVMICPITTVGTVTSAIVRSTEKTDGAPDDSRDTPRKRLPPTPITKIPMSPRTDEGRLRSLIHSERTT
jgi:hypothetical protein